MSLISTFTRLQDQRYPVLAIEMLAVISKSIRKASMLFFEKWLNSRFSYAFWCLWFLWNVSGDQNHWKASMRFSFWIWSALQFSQSVTQDDRISLMSLISTFTRLQDQRYPVLAIEMLALISKSIRKASMLFFWFFEINDWTRASVNLERASVSHTKDDRISLMSLISTFTRLQDQRYPVLAIEMLVVISKSIRKASMLFFDFLKSMTELALQLIWSARQSVTPDDRISLMSLISTFTRLQDQRYSVLAIEMLVVISKKIN